MYDYALKKVQREITNTLSKNKQREITHAISIWLRKWDVTFALLIVRLLSVFDITACQRIKSDTEDTYRKLYSHDQCKSRNE